MPWVQAKVVVPASISCATSGAPHKIPKRAGTITLSMRKSFPITLTMPASRHGGPGAAGRPVQVVSSVCHCEAMWNPR